MGVQPPSTLPTIRIIQSLSDFDPSLGVLEEKISISLLKAALKE